MTPHSDIRLFMRFEPDVPHLTHQNGTEPFVRKNGKPGIRKTRELLALEAKFVSLLHKSAPPKPWKCPIHLTTIWKFCAPKKITFDSSDVVWKTTRPDTDNLVKTLKDCLKVSGYYVDDAFVCLDTIGKVWVPEKAEHGIEIRLHDLTEK